jgi:ABC-2 type transport system ATP-binding protein
MIEIIKLVKEFRGGFRAVNDISFSVPRGQVLGFLGPNGAGKSTTMKIITGFLEPTSGTAIVGGKDVRKDSLAVRTQIGYLPESAPSYGEMAVSEFLAFIAEMRGKRGAQRDAAAQKMREVCFLQDVWHQPIETLSKGYKQRVGFAQALLHDPPVLILDEPTDGLDPNQKYEVRQLIKSMAADKTIILSTHILEEVEAMCQRVVIVALGKIVADATPEALKQKSVWHNAVTITLSSSDLLKSKDVFGSLDDVQKVEAVEDQANTVRVFPREGRVIAGTLSKLARERQWNIERMQIEQGHLDEVFRRVTSAQQQH